MCYVSFQEVKLCKECSLWSWCPSCPPPPHCMEPKGSLPCPQEHTNRPCPASGKSNPHPHSLQELCNTKDLCGLTPIYVTWKWKLAHFDTNSCWLKVELLMLRNVLYFIPIWCNFFLEVLFWDYCLMFPVPLIQLVHCTWQLYQHLKIIVFWDVQSFSWVHRHQHFRGTSCLHLQGRRECRQHVPPICWYMSTILYVITSRRRCFLYSPCKPQISHQCCRFGKGTLVMLMFPFHFVVV